MNTFSVSSLYQWPRHCTPKARGMVLNIIHSSKMPLATKDIYNLVVKPTRARTSAGAAAPPHASQEIRSMRYLKTVVLRDLVAQNRVEKVRTQGAFTAWLWRPKQQGPPASTTKSKPNVAASTLFCSMALAPAAVGVGEDWSHLSKRRQRARKMKVERDLQRMLEVQRQNKVLQH